MKVFCVEGLIGCGKTSVMNALKERFNKTKKTKICFIPEPVEVWEKQFRTGKKGLLELFYNDPKRYSFTLEVAVFTTLIKEIRKAKKMGAECVVIMERSLYSAFHVFSKMLYDDKKMERAEYKVLDHLFNELKEELPTPQIIYFKVEPNTALERIKKRGRKAEEGISVEYLENLEKYTKKWLNTMKENVVLKIDVNDEPFDKSWVDMVIQSMFSSNENDDKDFIIHFD